MQIVPKPNVHIRTAAPSDASSMMALEQASQTAAHCAGSFYRGLFEEGAAERISLAAEDDAGLQGFLIARITGDECELENIVVKEGRWRSGIGSSLIRALADFVRGRNAKRIFLEVRESNTAARALYERCGFRINGRRKSYYNDPQEDAVLYVWVP